nr:hypothetical protein [Tanacetum cinerariifolium]
MDGGITESMNQPGIKEDIHCKNSKLEGENNRKYDQPRHKEDHNNKVTKVEITGRNKDDLPGYKNDHKHYKKSDGGFNQKMDQEDLKTYTAAFVIREENIGSNPSFSCNPKRLGQTGQTGQSPTQLSNDS